jgi:hypothetical protein
MKRNALAAVLLTVLIAVTSITCGDITKRALGTEAKLLGLSIGNTLVPDMPASIENVDWENDQFQMVGANTGYANFKLDEDTKLQRVKPWVSMGATSEWGIGTRSTRPAEFYNTKVPISFESDEYVYLKITSETGDVTNYYRFFTKVFSWVTHLDTITIAGRSKEAKTPASDYDNAEEQRIDIAVAEKTGPEIELFLFDPNSTVKIARLPKTYTPGVVPDFKAPTTRLNFEDGDFLIVEVTAENTVTKNYYKFKVWIGHLAEIRNLFMINDDLSGAAKRMQIYNKGLFSEDWPKVGPGGFSTADLPRDGYGVDIELEDAAATTKYLLIETNVGAPKPNFAVDAVTGKVKFKFGQVPATENRFVLAIEVKAPEGEILYYAIKADILAALITAQPRSAWYYASYIDFDDPSKDKYEYEDFYPQTYPEKIKDTPASPERDPTSQERAAWVLEKKARQTVEPLTVTLDRSGSYQYQWYEADSWYGFYGRHGTSIDEKNNLTTVNGGPNQYFYLTDPDENQHPFSDPCAWAITGATSNTYSPRIDWINAPIKLPPGATQNNSVPIPPTPPEVNFITGATNECRYYWCVISDPSTGLKVVSERALIITEIHPAMEHYIFELTDLPRKKNIEPFKVLRELHKIPLTKGNTSTSIFPVGFDPYKYESMTAHARFFLPDGRPWTQNWTHGDIHFGYNDDSLTWWQNNLGANGGAIPLHTPHSSKGGLERAPDWIGFAPSGDPTKRVPEANWPASWPAQPPGIPPPIQQQINLGSYVSKVGELPKGIYASKGDWPSEIAQGWFAGFIELLEIRFSTSPPKKAEPEE